MIGRKKKSGRLNRVLSLTAIAVASYVLIFIILIMGVSPDQYDIHIGTPASKTIYATKDVEDVVTTEKIRTAAADAVEPTYKSVDSAVDVEVLADVRATFNRINTLRKEVRENEVHDLNAFNGKAPFEFNESMMNTLLGAEDDEYAAVADDCIEKVKDALDSSLPEGQEEQTIARIKRNIQSQFGTGWADVCERVMNLNVRPNMLVDREVTEANRQNARDAIESVMLVNREVIVREGEIVTEAEYQMIASLGLLADDSVDFLLVGGLAALDLLFCALMALYMFLFEKQTFSSVKNTVILSSVIIIEMLLCLGIRSFKVYLMPVSLAAIVLCILFDHRLAIFTSTVSAFMAAMLVPSEYLFSMTMYSVLLMGLASGPVMALVLYKRQLRSDVLLAGVVIGVANFISTICVGMINSANLNTTVVNAGIAIVSGILAAVLAIGLQSILEWVFNLPTNSKLIELSNPNQKLLRRLLLEAPGTYHHSIIVANLAEAAASAVGGNGLLARVGAYYHDIGKLKRPSYYKENQLNDNPHDRSDPRVSAAILTAHTRDGAQMAAKQKLPSAIIDIIRQHHGDTMAIYFFDKAVKLYGSEVDPSAFRYDGPRPRSIEAAVVMLADTIEAATRTLKDPTPESMEALIRKLVNAKMADGQLNESPLTFADIDKICSTFVTVLTGVFHQRIEYPDIPVPERPSNAVQSDAKEMAEANASAEDKENVPARENIVAEKQENELNAD